MLSARLFKYSIGIFPSLDSIPLIDFHSEELLHEFSFHAKAIKFQSTLNQIIVKTNPSPSANI